MQSIGERLEEARKRKGISLREASEATKIRSDFLANIEQGQFDFELPEIYKRGFVKNYANYLKLDPQSILADYDAYLADAPPSTKKNGSELFGSMELKPTQSNAKEPLLGKLSTASKVEETSEDAPVNIDKVFYLKLGLVLLGVVTFLIVVISLVAAVLGSDDEPIIETAGSGTPSTITTSLPGEDTSISTGPSVSLPASEETVSLIASGTVYVLVKQRNDSKELVRKTLSEGETHSFTKQGPIDILFTAGENLVIVDASGERLRPQVEGTAKILIP